MNTQPRWEYIKVFRSFDRRWYVSTTDACTGRSVRDGFETWREAMNHAHQLANTVEIELTEVSDKGNDSQVLELIEYACDYGAIEFYGAHAGGGEFCLRCDNGESYATMTLNREAALQLVAHLLHQIKFMEKSVKSAT